VKPNNKLTASNHRPRSLGKTTRPNKVQPSKAALLRERNNRKKALSMISKSATTIKSRRSTRPLIHVSLTNLTTLKTINTNTKTNDTDETQATPANPTLTITATDEITIITILSITQNTPIRYAKKRKSQGFKLNQPKEPLKTAPKPTT